MLYEEDKNRDNIGSAPQALSCLNKLRTTQNNTNKDIDFCTGVFPLSFNSDQIGSVLIWRPLPRAHS